MHGFFAGLGAVALVSMLAMPASAEPPAQDAMVSVDIADAELIDVVVYVSHLTGENFVLMEQALHGERLTVYAPTPMRVDEVDDFLRTVLVARGLDVERGDGFWKVSRPHR